MVCKIDPSQTPYVVTFIFYFSPPGSIRHFGSLPCFALYHVTSCKYIYLQFLSQPAAFIAFRKSPNEAIYFNAARSGTQFSFFAFFIMGGPPRRSLDNLHKYYTGYLFAVNA